MNTSRFSQKMWPRVLETVDPSSILSCVLLLLSLSALNLEFGPGFALFVCLCLYLLVSICLCLCVSISYVLRGMLFWIWAETVPWCDTRLCRIRLISRCIAYALCSGVLHTSARSCSGVSHTPCVHTPSVLCHTRFTKYAKQHTICSLWSVVCSLWYVACRWNMESGKWEVPHTPRNQAKEDRHQQS